jgi:hypothetical protein
MMSDAIAGRSLRRAVTAVCGPARELDVLGYAFAEWIESGPVTAHGKEVETVVAGYLAEAERAGRRWGTRAGFVAAAIVLACVGAGTLVWAVWA